MKIEVTQDDIKNGKRENPDACPIALAIKRTGFTKERLWVEPEAVYVDGDVLHEYELPDFAQEFIAAFDDCQPVKPFSFDLDI